MGVTALKMNVAGESTSHQFVPMAPNMCITPAAPSPLPLPYPLMGDTSKLESGCEDTKMEGKPSMNTNSWAKGLKGNEAGTQKDVVTFTTGGKAYALLGAPTVMFEGAMVVITGSPGMGNTM